MRSKKVNIFKLKLVADQAEIEQQKDIRRSSIRLQITTDI
jgi:hypothetical protein